MTKPQSNITCSNCGYAWHTKSKLILVSCPSCKHNIKNTTITPVYMLNDKTQEPDFYAKDGIAYDPKTKKRIGEVI